MRQLKSGIQSHFLKYLFCIFAELLLSETLSYSQVTPDSSTSTNCLNTCDTQNSTILINGGITRNFNLFHSFSEFSIREGQNVYFNNPSVIQNIITRVTGTNKSIILGKLGILGNANFFFINPNGIAFGPNSSLDINGSFIATTADSIQFNNQGIFSALSQETPNLLISFPSNLIFNRNNFNSIENASKVVSSNSNLLLDPQLGLNIKSSKSFLFVAGNISFDNGGIYTSGGSVELGSVIGPASIHINESLDKIGLSYPNNILYGNISLSNKSIINASGEKGGSISLNGKNISINTGSQVVSNTIGSLNGGRLLINAAELVKLDGFIQGGNISTSNYSSGNAGAIEIKAKDLLIRGGAQVFSTSSGSGKGGDIMVDVLNSTEISGSENILLNEINLSFNSGLFSDASLQGNGGDIYITTPNLFVSNKALISTSSSGIISFSNGDTVFIPATGSAGNLNIFTRNLIVQDNSLISVNSQGTGTAGELKINSDSISLYNNSSLNATTNGGAGDINLITNNIILRDKSSIKTDALGPSRGGNIKINAGVSVALGNSDITASSAENFGGKITFSTQKIFGSRYSQELTSGNDITASSKLGPDFSGSVDFDITDVNSFSSLVKLPEDIINPSSLVSQNPCKHNNGSEFVHSGRGGLPPSLSQDLDSNATQVDLIQPIMSITKNSNSGLIKKVEDKAPLDITAAQGWIYNDKGEVVLTEYNPNYKLQRHKPSPLSCLAF